MAEKTHMLNVYRQKQRSKAATSRRRGCYKAALLLI